MYCIGLSKWDTVILSCKFKAVVSVSSPLTRLCSFPTHTSLFMFSHFLCTTHNVIYVKQVLQQKIWLIFFLIVCCVSFTHLLCKCTSALHWHTLWCCVLPSIKRRWSGTCSMISSTLTLHCIPLDAGIQMRTLPSGG